jgi:hypothetical protein
VSVANPFDVASRLAEGQPAVDDVEEYVTACHRLGYQHPDLTAHPTQVRDCYASEDGLDLRALDGDCAVLSAVASAAEDAARTQADLVAELSAAWSGRGAAAAREFTWRSGQAASAVSVAVRASADAAATLRDELWRAVDAKVAAVQAIDGRHQAQRAQWLAAAKTMTGGAGDLAAASELIDQEVKPFVDNDIGTDWLTAMRAANASINGAYDAALATTTAAPRAVFEVPGELGPRAEPPEPVAATGDAPSQSPVQTVPAAAVASAPLPPAPASVPSPPVQPPASWSGSAPAPLPPLVDPLAQAPAASMPGATPSMPSLGDLGAGASPLGTGLSGFGQQLADLIGGLVGSTDDGLPDAAEIDGSEGVDDPDEPLTDEDEPGEPDTTDDEPVALPPDQDPVAEEIVESGEATVECDEPTDGPAPDPTPAPTTVEPAPDSPPPPPQPQPMPEAAAEITEPTPCEIAADELPQVGE